MSEAKRPGRVNVRVVKGSSPPPLYPARIEKADHATSLTREEGNYAGEWIAQPLSFDGIDALVDHSTILPQCIQAYRNNITGFGIEIEYKAEYRNQEETPGMIEEYNRAQRLIDLLCYDCSTQDMFGRLIATRERYGIAYAEVIRNMANEVCEIVDIQYPGSIQMTQKLDPYVAVPFFYNGEVIERRRKFRKFKQEVNGRTVYFREFGDPRIMDRRTGRYLDDGETLELEYQANEILEFRIGEQPYGTVRWIGQIAGVDGAFKAESLNRNYFENGRHTPMMIMVMGGTLTDESFEKLRGYMDEIKGEAGQHAFIVLEAENVNTSVGFEEEKTPDIQIKDLSPMLQKDELFQNYLDNVRRKCQSAFRLPDIYVGYTTDFNRATAQTAVEITEKQVFIPQRQELAWIINRKLLAEYQFRYVEVGFRAPDVTNPDDQAKILNIAERAGGVTPNEAHRMAASLTGDSAEDFEGDWGNIPLAYAQIANDKEMQAEQVTPLTPEIPRQPEDAGLPGEADALPDAGDEPPAPPEADADNASADDGVSESAGGDELVAIMKQVRGLLSGMGVERDGGSV